MSLSTLVYFWSIPLVKQPRNVMVPRTAKRERMLWPRPFTHLDWHGIILSILIKFNSMMSHPWQSDEGPTLAFHGSLMKDPH